MSSRFLPWFAFLALAGGSVGIANAQDECGVESVGTNWLSDYTGNGQGFNFWYYEAPSGNHFNSPPSDPQSIVTYNCQVQTGGKHTLYGYVWPTDGDDDSFWVRVNGGEWFKWNLIPPTHIFFKWHKVDRQPGSGTPVPITFNLAEGSNTVEFAHREEGATLALLTTLHENDSYTGTDDDAGVVVEGGGHGGESDKIYLKDEYMPKKRWERYAISNDYYDPDEWFLRAPFGNNLDSPPTTPNSSISYSFQAKGGTYSIYGRVRALTGNNDSFWIKVNDGSWVKWNLIEKSDKFIWDKVDHQPGSGTPVPASFNLVAGLNTLYVAHREELVGVTKWYITNTGDGPEQ